MAYHQLLQSFHYRHKLFRHGATLSAIILFTMLGVGILIWAGSGLKPPTFAVTPNGLITPVGYPLWRRASDWLARRRYIMLTFDDGPYGHGVDEQILATLAKHHAHAVFFEVCAHITNTTRHVPSEVLAAGSIVGNHSYDHKHLPALHGHALDHQIADCSSQLASITGKRPTLFRPPWGQLSPAVIKEIRAAGMRTVLWNANSGDTWLHSPQKIVHLSLYEAALGGSILLMHSKPATSAALDQLLTKLQQRGFQFVLPVSKHTNQIVLGTKRDGGN